MAVPAFSHGFENIFLFSANVASIFYELWFFCILFPEAAKSVDDYAENDVYKDYYHTDVITNIKDKPMPIIRVFRPNLSSCILQLPCLRPIVNLLLSKSQIPFVINPIIVRNRAQNVSKSFFRKTDRERACKANS